MGNTVKLDKEKLVKTLSEIIDDLVKEETFQCRLYTDNLSEGFHVQCYNIPEEKWRSLRILFYPRNNDLNYSKGVGKRFPETDEGLACAIMLLIDLIEEGAELVNTKHVLDIFHDTLYKEIIKQKEAKWKKSKSIVEK